MAQESGIGRRPAVAIGMPTFRRHGEVSRAIPPLLEQARALSGATARLIVVDNDPDGTARDVVEAFSDPLLTYVHEAHPGIAAARNRVLDVARDDDAVVFIDDDETPDPGWLQHLVDSWQAWACAGVSGPVTSVFETPVDPWVVSSGMFARADRPTGSVTSGASSANLLLDLGRLRRHGIRFDENFGLSGGSDSMLTHSLTASGEQVRWCQEAGVTEFVPASRTNRDWIVRRTMRTSNTWSRVGLILARDRGSLTRRRAEYTARGGYRLMRGVGNRALALLRDDEARDARGAVDVASGLGVILGTFGLVRYEYARTSGPAWRRPAPSRTTTSSGPPGRSA